MFVGLLDLDPLVTGPDPDLLPSSKSSKKNLDSYCFVAFYNFLSLINDVNVPSKSNMQKNLHSRQKSLKNSFRNNSPSVYF
jgi:hypothetical protein